MHVLLFIFSFMSGVAIATLFSTSYVWIFVCLPLFFLSRKAQLVLVFGFILGFTRTLYFETNMMNVWPPESSVEIVARVVDVHEYDSTQRVRFRSGPRVVHADFSKYDVFELGETWHLTGTFARGDAGFDWSRRDVGEWVDPRVYRMDSPPFWMRIIQDVRRHMTVRVERMLDPPISSLVLGLVLGSRESFSDDLTQAFRASGLMHLVAISGYNIRLVVSVFFLIFSYLEFRRRVFLTLIFILLFVILVGGGAAVWRAALMGSLSLLVTVAGYRKHAYFILFWSGFFMVMINPYSLLYDLGFQLSFLSTWGLMAFVPFFDAYLQRFPVLFRESLSLTLASQIATFPILVHAFEMVSLVSLFANIAVAPFLPIAFFASVLLLFLGPPAALVAQFFLQVIVWIATFFAGLSWAQVPIHFSSFDWSLYFLGLALLFWALYKPKLDRALGRDRGLKL